MFGLTNELIKVNGIGEKTVKYFEKKEIFTVEDLLVFLPISYTFFEENKFVDKEKILFKGTITSKLSSYRPRSNLLSTRFKVSDGINDVNIIAWNQRHLTFSFKEGDYVEILGKFDESRNQITLNKISKVIETEVSTKKMIVPIYSKINKLSNLKINKLINSLIDGEVKDQKVKEMLYGLHTPKSEEQIYKAQQEFKKIELAIYLKKIDKLKQKKLAQKEDNIINVDMNVVNALKNSLPFSLTMDQENTIIETLKKMQSKEKLQSLILGDVGSGKTIVSIILSSVVISNSMQVAIMVPTDILARQFFEQVKTYLPNAKAELLIGSVDKRSKERIKSNLKHGLVDVVVGTHALLEDDVEFKDLKFVVIDEQHRFGVMQRETLLNKGANVNYIYLSATPIPRTIAHTLYGVIDVIRIKNKPRNRKEIITQVFSLKEKKEMLKLFESEIEKGNQGFIVTPLAYEVEDFNLADSYSTFQKFEKYYAGKYNVGVINGQIKPRDKEKVMQLFKERKYDILVATTVIEVGVDIPGATVMMIMNAERFGVAQLHQLRGRVGRNDKQSYCLMQNTTSNEISKQRLELLKSSTDGYLLAKEDYKLRQSGEVTGIRQSGQEDFILFDPANDYSLLEEFEK